MRIEVALYDGFDEVDAFGPFEVLANAASLREGVSVTLAGALGPGEILASHGARIVCDEGLSDGADLVIVPGGGWHTDAPGTHGTRAAYDAGVIPARLAELAAGGAAVASVCTGALLLAKAGLLQGRPATTHHRAFDDLAATGALVDREARVVDDGEVLSCGGVTSGLDLALRIVEREWGRDPAAMIATLMEHERRGPVRTRD